MDAEFEVLEQGHLNGAPCRVRHIKDYFQGCSVSGESPGIVALRLEIIGDLEPFCDLLRRSQAAIVEVATEHA